MIVDASKQTTATGIVNFLREDIGVLNNVNKKITLSDLQSLTGEDQYGLPAFYNVDANNRITAWSNTKEDLIPVAETPDAAPLLPLAADVPRETQKIRMDLLSQDPEGMNRGTLSLTNPQGQGAAPPAAGADEGGLWKGLMGVGSEMFEDVKEGYGAVADALRDPIIGETIGGPRTPRVDTFTAPAVQELQTARQLRPRDVLPVEEPPEPTAAVKQEVMQGEVPPGDEEVALPISTEERLQTQGSEFARFRAAAESDQKQYQEEVRLTITDPASKNIYDETIEKIEALMQGNAEDGGFNFFGSQKQDYESLAATLNTQIGEYNTTIQEIAEEKQKPAFEGINKFWAVIAASLGAAGATLGKTPNYAMQVIESAIDADAKKFLASQAMRTKSAETQRLDLIRRRGEILQFAQNEVTKTIQMKSLQVTGATAIANITRIQESLKLAQDKNKQDYELKVTQLLASIVIAETAARATMGAKQRELLIPGVTLKSGDGEENRYPAFLAKSPREAREIRNKSAIYQRADQKLSSLSELLKKKERFAPQAFSATAVEIKSLGAQLETDFKNLNEFGANYSEREIKLNTAVIPMTMDTGTVALMMQAQMVLKSFQRKINLDYSTIMESQGAGNTSIRLPSQKKNPLEAIPGIKLVETP